MIGRTSNIVFANASAAFLASKDSSFITGIELSVDGGFTPVLAKHSKSFSVVDAISVGVDRMRRNFEPMRKQVEAWRQAELSDVAAKMNHLRGVH